MNEIAASIIAVVGTLMGASLAFVFQSRLSARDAADDRQDRRRQEFVDATAELIAAISTLIQAEYDRAKRRLNEEDGERREHARQVAYDRRTDTRTALYRFRLLGDVASDSPLLATAERAIEASRAISANTPTLHDADARNHAAKHALEKLVTEAGQRIDQA
jgi:hypothetical protein